MTQLPISNSPKTEAHLRQTLERLRTQIPPTLGGDLTLLGGALFPENLPTGSNIAIGEVVYVNAAGTIQLAVATALSTSRAIGVAKGVTVSPAPADIQVDGVIEVPGAGFVPNTAYYLSATTPGGLVTMPDETPGNTVVLVGVAVSATRLKLLLTSPILL